VGAVALDDSGDEQRRFERRRRKPPPPTPRASLDLATRPLPGALGLAVGFEHVGAAASGRAPRHPAPPTATLEEGDERDGEASVSASATPFGTVRLGGRLSPPRSPELRRAIPSSTADGAAAARGAAAAAAVGPSSADAAAGRRRADRPSCRVLGQAGACAGARESNKYDRSNAAAVARIESRAAAASAALAERRRRGGLRRPLERLRGANGSGAAGSAARPRTAPAAPAPAGPRRAWGARAAADVAAATGPAAARIRERAKRDAADRAAARERLGLPPVDDGVARALAAFAAAGRGSAAAAAAPVGAAPAAPPPEAVLLRSLCGTLPVLEFRGGPGWRGWLHPEATAGWGRVAGGWAPIPKGRSTRDADALGGVDAVVGRWGDATDPSSLRARYEATLGRRRAEADASDAARRRAEAAARAAAPPDDGPDPAAASEASRNAAEEARRRAADAAASALGRIALAGDRRIGGGAAAAAGGGGSGPWTVDDGARTWELYPPAAGGPDRAGLDLVATALGRGPRDDGGGGANPGAVPPRAVDRHGDGAFREGMGFVGLAGGVDGTGPGRRIGGGDGAGDGGDGRRWAEPGTAWVRTTLPRGVLGPDAPPTGPGSGEAGRAGEASLRAALARAARAGGGGW